MPTPLSGAWIADEKYRGPEDPALDQPLEWGGNRRMSIVHVMHRFVTLRFPFYEGGQMGLGTLYKIRIDRFPHVGFDQGPHIVGPGHIGQVFFECEPGDGHGDPGRYLLDFT